MRNQREKLKCQKSCKKIEKKKWGKNIRKYKKYMTAKKRNMSDGKWIDEINTTLHSDKKKVNLLPKVNNNNNAEIKTRPRTITTKKKE